MYFGSIRFFKHLILGIIAALIIVPTTMTGVLLVKVNSYQNTIQALKKGQDRVSGNLVEPATPISTKSAAADLAYQTLYPNLKVTPPQMQTMQKKVVYLTFDDGPSNRTLEILRILRKQHIKATFFVVGKSDNYSKAIMRQIVKQGHTIGVHTYSHNYQQVYASVEAFLADFNREYNLVYQATGVRPNIFRFPGGSINGHNARLYPQIIAEMIRRGFEYYDWNVSSNDAVTSQNSVANIVQASTMGVGNFSRIFYLAHDSAYKTETVQALPSIIHRYRAAGYKFDKLTNHVKPVRFSYTDY
jgi:peptidoglycan/xylan/chitin deacetylase (PgdA/CDA1 family)